MKDAKMMMNMAMAIASINHIEIDRMDLQRHSSCRDPWYHLDVWYTDGKEITILQDCTIVERSEEEER